MCIANSKLILSVGLATATLAVVLTYVLGAQAILQSPYAEPGHELFMSMYMPLVQGITGHASQSQQMHGGSASQSQMDTGPQTQNQFGIIGNNILGSPAGLAAGGLAAVVVMGVITLAGGAFVVSWKQRSFVMAGLLAASGIILMIPALMATGYFAAIVFPGPIIGVVVGMAIFGLGVAKGMGTAKAVTAGSR